MSEQPVLTVLFMALLGAFLFRVRGGFLPTGSSLLARSLYAGGLTVAAVACRFDWMLLALFPAFLAGALFAWWDSIDLARNEGKWVNDFAVMLGRGMIFTAPAGVVLYLLGYSSWVFVFVAGLTCAPLYELAWRIPSQIPNFRQGPELGEAFFGAAIGAALAVSVL